MSIDNTREIIHNAPMNTKTAPIKKYTVPTKTDPKTRDPKYVQAVCAAAIPPNKAPGGLGKKLMYALHHM